MFFLLSKILYFISDPMVWVGISLLLAILVKSAKRKKRLLWTSFGIFYFFSNTFICDEFMRALETPGYTLEENERYDAAIVLGGFSTYNFELQRVNFHESSDRFFRAIELYRACKIDKIILSGGSGSVLHPEQTEGKFMAEYAQLLGIPAEDILWESTSRNTRENALETQKILEQHPELNDLLLITSAHHMPRASRCFQKVGISCKPFPSNNYVGYRQYEFAHLFIPNVNTPVKWQAMLHEWMGYVSYWMSGYI